MKYDPSTTNAYGAGAIAIGMTALLTGLYLGLSLPAAIADVAPDAGAIATLILALGLVAIGVILIIYGVAVLLSNRVRIHTQKQLDKLDLEESERAFDATRKHASTSNTVDQLAFRGLKKAAQNERSHPHLPATGKP